MRLLLKNIINTIISRTLEEEAMTQDTDKCRSSRPWLVRLCLDISRGIARLFRMIASKDVVLGDPDEVELQE
jgi:hypothetical protein